MSTADLRTVLARAQRFFARLNSFDLECPHCGTVSQDHYKLEGDAHRDGLYKCKDCREQFTVTVGTVFERSKVKLNVWLQAMHLMCSSKKGISSKQLERMLGVTYQTA